MTPLRATLITLCSLAATACSDAGHTQQALDEGIDRVSFATSGRLEIITGDQPGLVLESEDADALERLRIAVEGDRLIIEQREAGNWWSWFRGTDIHARVVLQSVEAVGFAGVGELDVKGVDGAALAVQIAGRADCAIEALAVNELNVQLAGAAECSVHGRAARQQLQVAGAGMYRGYGLETEFTRVEIAGAADVEVNASQMLHVEVSGSGSVTYLGDPALHGSVAGWGSVARAEGPQS